MAPHPLNKRYQVGTQHVVTGYAHRFRILNDKVNFLAAARQENLTDDQRRKVDDLLASNRKQRDQLMRDFAAELEKLP